MSGTRERAGGTALDAPPEMYRSHKGPICALLLVEACAMVLIRDGASPTVSQARGLILATGRNLPDVGMKSEPDIVLTWADRAGTFKARSQCGRRTWGNRVRRRMSEVRRDLTG